MHHKKHQTRAGAIYNLIEMTDAGRCLTALSSSTNFIAFYVCKANRPRIQFYDVNCNLSALLCAFIALFKQSKLKIMLRLQKGFIDDHKYSKGGLIA